MSLSGGSRRSNVSRRTNKSHNSSHKSHNSRKVSRIKSPDLPFTYSPNTPADKDLQSMVSKMGVQLCDLQEANVKLELSQVLRKMSDVKTNRMIYEGLWFLFTVDGEGSAAVWFTGGPMIFFDNVFDK